MPGIKNIPGPYRFFFYSFDCGEPKHVHVQRDKLLCKIWLEPIYLGKNDGFSPKDSTSFGNLSKPIYREYWRLGMNTVVNVVEPRLLNAEITEDEIIAHLMDGRTISVPLIWSWRLSEATEEQRQNFEILGDGQGIHWPDIDEDISVEGMLHGAPARRPHRQAA